jgi:hypothetical protein
LPEYSQIGTEEFPVLEIIDQYGPLYGQCKTLQVCFNPIIPIMIHAVILPSKKIPFFLLLLLPSFAQTVQVQVATQFFKLVPDGSDLLPEDSQLGAERRKQW